MKLDEEIIRQEAIKRRLNGEMVTNICSSLHRSRRWFYHWYGRYKDKSTDWFRDKSKRPHRSPDKTPPELEKKIIRIRNSLSRQGLFHGAQATQWEMAASGMEKIPSIATINRIFKRNNLIEPKVKRYEPKGKAYPYFVAKYSNHMHQLDLVGPCYLRGSQTIRFYSFNAVDVFTRRCGVQPSFSKASQNVIDAVWLLWHRLGIPKHLQVDNELSFHGSNRYPRAMGSLIRLCLHNKVTLWFIPMKEPWRNGIVEKFNEHFRQKLLNRIPIRSNDELVRQSLSFESLHNSRYRYSVLKGRTPIQMLNQTKGKLRFPCTIESPGHPLSKPKDESYNIVRFIRSDCLLHIFGEKFPLPLEAQYEYVVASVFVKEQKLKVYLNNQCITNIDY
jgi:hypothetical protein